MWPMLFAVAVTLLLAAVALCLVLWCQRVTLASQLQDQAAQTQAQREDASQWQTRAKVAEKAQQSAKEQTDAAHKQLREAFQSLSGDVLKDAQKQFFELAKPTFESQKKDHDAQLDQRRQAIEALVKPLGDNLDKQQIKLQELEKNRQGAYSGLKQQIESMAQTQQHLQLETGNLVSALRRPEVRGRWGEVQLERVVELAGMQENVDFATQFSIHRDEARLRPDMTINLPAGRTIVVDAKTPLDAYLDSIKAEDDQARQQCLDRHAKQIDEQVRNLSSKSYTSNIDGSPDFVVLFIPGENFLEAAVKQNAALIESAMEKNVVIATPSTLISLLKAVDKGWQEQRLADNAQRIQELGQQLHDRVRIVVEHAQKLGMHLDRAVGSYNEFVGSLDSRVLVTTRKMRDLGVESGKKLPDDLGESAIETKPRQLELESDVDSA